MPFRLLKNYENIALNPSEIKGKIDFNTIFDTPAPVQIEIGSGRGTFLVNQAKSQPSINFIGIEWARKYYRYSVDRLGRWGLKNVRIIRTDAVAFIAENVPDSSVEGFHIYFPDPWPKKRHHKRRFLQQSNLDQMLRCLSPEGLINIATDHEEYFEWMNDLVDQNTNKVTKIDFLKPTGAEETEHVGTNFERKYLKLGKKTHALALKKM